MWGIRVSCPPGQRTFRAICSVASTALTAARASAASTVGWWLPFAGHTSSSRWYAVAASVHPRPPCPPLIIASPSSESAGPRRAGFVALFFWRTATSAGRDGRLASAPTIACCHFCPIALAQSALNVHCPHMPSADWRGSGGGGGGGLALTMRADRSALSYASHLQASNCATAVLLRLEAKRGETAENQPCPLFNLTRAPTQR